MWLPGKSSNKFKQGTLLSSVTLHCIVLMGSSGHDTKESGNSVLALTTLGLPVKMLGELIDEDLNYCYILYRFHFVDNGRLLQQRVMPEKIPFRDKMIQ